MYLIKKSALLNHLFINIMLVVVTSINIPPMISGFEYVWLNTATSNIKLHMRHRKFMLAPTPAFSS